MPVFDQILQLAAKEGARRGLPTGYHHKSSKHERDVSPGLDDSQTSECELLVELDMRMTCDEWKELKGESSSTGKRSSIYGSVRKWSMPIHYYYDGHFEFWEKREVRGAIDDIEATTCISFKETVASDNSVSHKIKFADGKGCSSWVGMKYQHQEITLNPNCRRKGVVIHEILHALGSLHEQERTDRDKYVTVHVENIDKDALHNFDTYKTPPMLNYDIPYDYNSIMHYGQYWFTSNGKPVLTTKDSAYQDVIGQRRGLSFLDIRTMNAFYNCVPPDDCGLTDCPGEGFVDKDCQCVCGIENIGKTIMQLCGK